MNTDTPTTSSLRTEDLLSLMYQDSGNPIPQACPHHRNTRVEDMLIDDGRVHLVTFGCGCRIPVVRPHLDSQRHSWR